MIEATSDERFDDKVHEECDELPLELSQVYATIALATGFRQYVTLAEVLLSVGDSSNEALDQIQRLVNAKSVVRTEPNQLRVRHRVIADKVVDHYRVAGVLRAGMPAAWSRLTVSSPDRYRKPVRRAASSPLSVVFPALGTPVMKMSLAASAARWGSELSTARRLGVIRGRCPWVDGVFG